MAKGSKSEFVVLKDSSSGRSTGLKLLRDDQGQLMYSWDLAPALAPEASSADVNYGQFSPDQELVWNQHDWSAGGLKFYYDQQNPARYGIAEGTFALTPNEVALSYQPKTVTFGVRNGGGQLGATTNWATSGVTLAIDTTAPHSGDNHFTGTAWSTNDYCAINCVQSEQPAARLVSQPVTAVAHFKSTDSGGTMKLQIVESGGSSTPTTTGDNVTISTSYQTVSSTVTLQSDSTQVQIRLVMNASGGSDRTIYFDSVQLLVGSAIPNVSNCVMGFIGTDLYAVTDRSVWKFDDTSDYWCLQKCHAAVITGAQIFDNSLFIGQGESTAYSYSDADDLTSWTAATGSGNKANRFSKTLNQNGNWALVKSLNDDDIHLSTSPTGAAIWSEAIECGKDDHKINTLHQLLDGLAVGKEDGLYQYVINTGSSTFFSDGQFKNVFPGAEAMVSTDNFSRGLVYNGMFYTVLGETAFVRYDGRNFQDISAIIQSPAFSEFGSRVRGLGTDGEWLYALVEDLNEDSVTKQSWLLALKEIGGEWVVHQVATLVLSDVLDMVIHKPSGDTNRYMYINGDVNDVAFCYRFLLPNRTSTPRLGTDSEVIKTGYFTTSYYDGGRPGVYKSLNEISIVSEDVSSTEKITVHYQVDNATSWTAVNSTSSEFTGSPSGTILFDTGIIGKRVRLRFTLETATSTTSPVLKGFILKMSWRPERLKRWRLTVGMDDNMRTMLGVSYSMPLKQLKANLDFLQQEVAPIIMDDIDGDQYFCNIVEMAEAQVRASSGANLNPVFARAMNLILREAKPNRNSGWNTIRWGEFTWG